MASQNVNMDAVEALHVALQQSFSPDASVRVPAEASIKHLKFVPGATQMLIHITEEKQVCWLWRFVNHTFFFAHLLIMFFLSYSCSGPIRGAPSCSHSAQKYLSRMLDRADLLSGNYAQFH